MMKWSLTGTRNMEDRIKMTENMFEMYNFLSLYKAHVGCTEVIWCRILRIQGLCDYRWLAWSKYEN